MWLTWAASTPALGLQLCEGGKNQVKLALHRNCKPFRRNSGPLFKAGDQ